MPQHHATGPFEVQLLPQPADGDAVDGLQLGRLQLDKRYHGDLQASGRGQMLSARSSVAGSAGYVAIEQVQGSLQGRSGSFVLQHHGLMDRGAKQLSITVVPDSGAGELLGLAGRMDIRIDADGRHFYDFDYTLP